MTPTPAGSALLGAPRYSASCSLPPCACAGHLRHFYTSAQEFVSRLDLSGRNSPLNQLAAVLNGTDTPAPPRPAELESSAGDSAQGHTHKLADRRAVQPEQLSLQLLKRHVRLPSVHKLPHVQSIA